MSNSSSPSTTAKKTTSTSTRKKKISPVEESGAALNDQHDHSTEIHQTSLPLFSQEAINGTGPVNTSFPWQTPMNDMVSAFTQWWGGWIKPMSEVTSAYPMQEAVPVRVLDLQKSYMERLSELFSGLFMSASGETATIKDSRFSDKAWQTNPLAAFYAKAYLLNSEYMMTLASEVDTDPKSKARLQFALNQWIDAVSPANYLATNPVAQTRLLETNGESLALGLQNLLHDMAKGRISQTDDNAFEVGKNVAVTEGAVVYENAVMQLIQYKPLTEKVWEQPLLIVPPCINKFYILDLQPHNSLVRYCVEKGLTTFIVSWKNPQEGDDAFLTWDDYVEHGCIAALDAVCSISGQDKIHALGFCIGGTLLSCALSILKKRGIEPVQTMTLLTALLDFEDTGVLDIFVDENQVSLREKTIGYGGLMPGRDLANTFSSLRANDLVWNYVVNNYLEGKAPTPFDLLYWNGDSTNLPGPMYSWYLRNTYLENALKQPNAVKCCGETIDLTLLNVPSYIFAAREDHIVQWKASYRSARVLTGVPEAEKRFVLGASGHIAGTINPASKNKRSYWCSESSLNESSDRWLENAKEYQGSWWNDWSVWLASHSSKQVSAPKGYGNHQYAVIEPAPGRYVKVKASS